MSKKKAIILIIASLTVVLNCIADEAITSTTSSASPTLNVSGNAIPNVQKVIEEFKAYLATISPGIRNEIVDYRKIIAELNKQKKEKYQNLSNEAKDYLKIEQQFKKRLPLQNKSLVNLSG